LTESLRTGEPQNEAKHVGDLFANLYTDPARLEGFLRAMTGMSLPVAQALSCAFPWNEVKTVIDVGTAQGCVPVQLASAHPHLTGGGFDLPAVGPIFSQFVASRGLADRLQFFPGDFLAGELPSADVLVMGLILHDWDLPTKRMLLGKAYAALEKGGSLIVYELLIDDERRMHVPGLLMSLNMLIETRGGFDYTGAAERGPRCGSDDVVIVAVDRNGPDDDNRGALPMSRDEARQCVARIAHHLEEARALLLKAAVLATRQHAARTVHEADGLPGLLALAAASQQPGLLGQAVAQLDLPGTEAATLFAMLAAPDAAQAWLARGYVAGRFDISGWEWADAVLTGPATEWKPAQRVAFLGILPPMGCTWDWVERFDRDTERGYWTNFVPFGLHEPASYPRAAALLLKHGRPHAAVEILGLYQGRVEIELDPDLAADALEALRSHPLPSTADVQMLPHHIAELLDMLDRSRFEQSRLAHLEWAFLVWLEGRRQPKVLLRELSRDPEFFAEIVGWVYRAEGEERSPANADQLAKAQLGQRLLKSCTRLPGQGDDGTLDARALFDWIDKARQQLRQNGQAHIGDHCIGELLAHAPSGSDGNWPHEEVRELIEALGNTDVELGFELSVLRQRGVTSRGLTHGGDQERQLVARYRAQAHSLANQWPLSSALLRRIADAYASQATWEDTRAELTEDLWR
jgi:O-methyltransferase domain